MYRSFGNIHRIFKCSTKKPKKNKSKMKNKSQLLQCQQSKIEKDTVQIQTNENICKGKKNLAAVLYTKGFIRLEERARPEPCRPGEVVVAMNCVGLNATDANYYNNGIKALPFVIGSDGTGIVAQLGKGVRKLREGDRVVIEPNVPCDRCSFCRVCQRHLCQHMRTYGMEPFDGLLTCYHAHNANYVHKLTDNLTMEEGVLLGQLAVGVNVCKKCSLCPGSPFLIIGAGLTGLTVSLAAKATGATNICLLCKCRERLNFARQFKIKTMVIPEEAQAEDVAQTLREALGCAPTVAVDTVGTEQSMQLAIKSVSDGGKIFLASTSDPVAKLPLKDIVTRDLSISSAFHSCNKYQAAIALTSSSAIDLKPLISHHYYFEEITKAMETLVNSEELVNKVVVHIRPRDRNNFEPF